MNSKEAVSGSQPCLPSDSDDDDLSLDLVRDVRLFSLFKALNLPQLQCLKRNPALRLSMMDIRGHKYFRDTCVFFFFCRAVHVDHSFPEIGPSSRTMIFKVGPRILICFR